jgi:hypothetical protein
MRKDTRNYGKFPRRFFQEGGPVGQALSNLGMGPAPIDMALLRRGGEPAPLPEHVGPTATGPAEEQVTPSRAQIGLPKQKRRRS